MIRTNLLQMRLQFFGADGTGGGDSNQNTGDGDANQNSGQQGNTTYTQEQLDGIVNGRVARAEQSALKSFFEQQGMNAEEVNKAIADYKTAKQNQQPDVTDIQNQLNQAQALVQKAEIEKQATFEALALGIDLKTIPYLLKLTDLSTAVGNDGKVNQEAIKSALNKVLEDMPQLKPSKEQSNGFKQVGADGNNNNNNNNDDELSRIFGNKK